MPDPRDFPPLPPRAHRHSCATETCVNYLICHQPADQCSQYDPWFCPTCEHQHLNAQLEQQFQDIVKKKGF